MWQLEGGDIRVARFEIVSLKERNLKISKRGSCSTG
jgi:hypothetical protein